MIYRYLSLLASPTIIGACTQLPVERPLPQVANVPKLQLTCASSEDVARLESDPIGLSFTMRCGSRSATAEDAEFVELKLTNTSMSRAFWLASGGFYQGLNVQLDLRLASGQVVFPTCLVRHRHTLAGRMLYPGESLTGQFPLMGSCYHLPEAVSPATLPIDVVLMARYTALREDRAFDLVSNAWPAKLTRRQP